MEMNGADLFPNVSEKEFNDILLKSSPSLLYIYDLKKSRIVYLNDKAEALLGYSLGQLKKFGKEVLDHIIHEDDIQKVNGHLDTLRKTKSDDIQELDFRVCTFSGDIKYLHVWHVPFSRDDSGKVEFILGTASDTTPLVEQSEKLNFLTDHDALTGLYNRTFIENFLRDLDADKDAEYSIIFADIDGLKFYNDTFGEHTGDQILRESAKAITSIIPSSSMVARSNGDEFIIYLPNCTRNHAQSFARLIRQRCRYIKFSYPIVISLSVGSATHSAYSREKADQLLNKAENKMYKSKLTNQESTYKLTFMAIKKSLREIEGETRAHSDRLEHLAVALGKSLGLTKAELRNLSLLAQLHDIGKVVIPNDILRKIKKLTPEERAVIERHPAVGYKLALNNRGLAQIAPLIRAHHERWDGKGYPDGIKEEEIPFLSRIISVVDTFDVMTKGRVYSSPRSIPEALAEIKRNSGTQFDPVVAEAFIHLFDRR